MRGPGKPCYRPPGQPGIPSDHYRELWFEFDDNDNRQWDYSEEGWGPTYPLRCSFPVPDDFTNLVECNALIMSCHDEVNRKADINTEYGADGEVYNNHTENDQLTGIATSSNSHFTLNMATIVTGLAAGDRVGLEIDMVDFAYEQYALGLLFRYN